MIPRRASNLILSRASSTSATRDFLSRRSLVTVTSSSSSSVAPSARRVVARASAASVVPTWRRAFSSTRIAQAKINKPFLLADIGEGITEVEIVKWLVEDGQTIDMFDPIVEVMSDKATVEITSPYAGRVRALSGAVGDVIRVGKTLCEVEVEGEDGEASAPTESPPPVATEAMEKPPPSPSEMAAPAFEAAPSASSSAPESKPIEGRGEVWATPATRRIAREHSVNLNHVPGTGKDGRVTKCDVLDFVAKKGVSPSSVSSSSAAASSSAPAPKPSSTGEATTIPLTGIRKAMFRSMTSSLAIPHFSYSETLDVTLLERLRLSLNSHIPLTHRATLTHAEEAQLTQIQSFSPSTTRLDEPQRISKITLLPLLIKALSQALYDNPLFLSMLSPSQDSLRLRRSHDISIALSSPTGGLYTPLLPNVESSTPYDLASQIAELQKTVPKFPPRHQGSGTITLSNVGVIGGTTTHPIIPPTGQLAIGALGRMRVEPRYVKESEKDAIRIAKRGGEDVEGLVLKMEPRLLMDVTFSADHRVVEGVELARLVESWKRIVEEPTRLSGMGR